MAHPRAVPRPARALDHLKVLSDPGAQPIPARITGFRWQTGSATGPCSRPPSGPARGRASGCG
jgi:hypothetical protein